MLEKGLEIIKILNEEGYEAYIVGGFVRDLLMDRNGTDVDICTSATPKEIKDLFENVELPFEQYGAVKLKYKKKDFEITTFRKDLEYINNRTPSKINYVNDLYTDLIRRDFTINTICINSKNEVIDLLNGREDIEKKIIRMIGNPSVRLKEDSLRILRAIRIATELNFRLDDDLKEAILSNGSLLKELSFFRKKQELNKIFSSNNTLYGLSLIKQLKLEKYLGIAINENIQNTTDPVGIWAQVNPCDEYNFNNNEKDYIKKIRKIVSKGSMSNLDIYNYGNYVCYIVAQIFNIDESVIHERFDSLPIKKREDIDFDMGMIDKLLIISDKRNIGLIIDEIEFKIINGELDNNYDSIKEYIVNNYENRNL